MLSAGTTGTGLSISTLSNNPNADANTQFLVQGNDFNNDAIGVAYIGDTTSGSLTVGTDLGGGGHSKAWAATISAASRRPPAPHGAIVMTITGTAPTLAAQHNIFFIGRTPPASVVFVNNLAPGGGSATIDVTPTANGRSGVCANAVQQFPRSKRHNC